MGPLPTIPDAVHQLIVAKRTGGEGVRLWVDDLAGLQGLVDIGVVELHPWNATVNDIEHADQIVLDLDPGAGVDHGLLIDTAFGLREILEAEGLTGAGHPHHGGPGATVDARRGPRVVP
jgi:bifunctional non-homologous end joining protein LigD